MTEDDKQQPTMSQMLQALAKKGSKDDYFSVLEERDMSNPRYREYLEKQQGLEGSYPETFAAPIARGLSSAAKTAKAIFAPEKQTGQIMRNPIGWSIRVPNKRKFDEPYSYTLPPPAPYVPRAPEEIANQALKRLPERFKDAVIDKAPTNAMLSANDLMELARMYKEKEKPQNKAEGGTVEPTQDEMRLALLSKRRNGMYSPLEKLAVDIPRTKGTGAEFMAEISKQKGFKPEEVADRKIPIPEQKMTKLEFLKHLRAHSNPPLQEFEMPDMGTGTEVRNQRANDYYGDDYDKISPEQQIDVADWVRKHNAKYSQYQIPGGENYREMLLKLPALDVKDERSINYLQTEKRRTDPTEWANSEEGKRLEALMVKARKFDTPFTSGHWRMHPNTLAHVRLSDREGANGEKLLHLEELQSDWHQQGRKKSYANYKASEEKELFELQKKQYEGNLSRDEADRINELQSKINIGAVPDAPFKKSWHELGMKHVLHHAAKNGYDGVVITPGDEQAERWGDEGLKVHYDKKIPEFLNKFGKPFGAQVGMNAHQVDIPRQEFFGDYPVEAKTVNLHHFPINDKMRTSILKEGMPQYMRGGIVHKAEGGAVLPIEQIKAQMMKKGLGQLQSIGANEAPSMGIKAYVPTSGSPDAGRMPVGGIDTSQGSLPVGGVDMSKGQPGNQLAPQGMQQGMNQVPQGDKIPTMDGTGMPPNPNANPNQMGSNILQMTPQGQAMAALKPQGLAKGGQVSTDQMRNELLNRPRPLSMTDDHGYADGGSVFKEADEPKKTVKAYKLFRTDKKKPGKLFPLFVDANKPVETGKWLAAQEGQMRGKKVRSKIGDLAYRPGWHAGDLPVATHIGEKSDPSLSAPDTRPDNHVWAEVEMPHDVDWQSEADKRGINAKGKLIAKKAHITDQIPHGGHYRYKTNPNMTGNWLIGGAMKVNRVLSEAEVKKINKSAGVADLPRAKKQKLSDFGFAEGGVVRMADGGNVDYSRSRFFDPKNPFAAGRALDKKYADKKYAKLNLPLMSRYGGRYADELSTEAGQKIFSDAVGRVTANTGLNSIYKPTDLNELAGIEISRPEIEKFYSQLYANGNSYFVPDYLEVDSGMYSGNFSPVDASLTREEQNAQRSAVRDRLYFGQRLANSQSGNYRGQIYENGMVNQEAILRYLLQEKERLGKLENPTEKNDAFRDLYRQNAHQLAAFDVGRGDLTYEQGDAIARASEYQRYLEQANLNILREEQALKNTQDKLANLTVTNGNTDTYDQMKAAYLGQIETQQRNLDSAKGGQAIYQSTLDPYLQTIAGIQNRDKLSSLDVLNALSLSPEKALEQAQMRADPTFVADPKLVSGMAKGGGVKSVNDMKAELAAKKSIADGTSTRVKIDAEGPGGVKGIVVPRHMWEGKTYKGEGGKKVEGMRDVNEARAKVYGSERRDPLSSGQMNSLHKKILAEHFQKPLEEQKQAEEEALNKLREAKHIGKTANTLDKSEKLDTVNHEEDSAGRNYVGFASKGVAGHSLYTSGHGENQKHHVINTCAGQTVGCGGGTDKNGIVDTSRGTCFAPNAESQYVNAAVRRASHEQAKHDPAMSKDWILAHTGSLRNAAENADKKNKVLLFRPNVVDETDVTSRHAIRHLNDQRKATGKPSIEANSYGKTNELHDPENGYHVTHSNVGPKVKKGQEISENIARDKARVRNTVMAADNKGDFKNEQGNKTPPKGSYMVTDVKRGSEMSKNMEKHITHAKYWTTGRPKSELTPEEISQGEEGHYGGDHKPTTEEDAHYGHKTVKGLRFDYQKQHVLHPRLVQVGFNEDGSKHMIPTDSRFKDTEFLPKDRFKSKNGKDAGHILMTTPTESTSHIGHQTSFTHHVNDSHIEHAKKNKGEYEIDKPEDQLKASGKEYTAPQAIKFYADGGEVNGRHAGLSDDDFHAFPEQNYAAQRHMAMRGHDKEPVTQHNLSDSKRKVTMNKDMDTMVLELTRNKKAK